MIHPGLYNLICADGVLLRCYGRSKYPRILRMTEFLGIPKFDVYEESGLLKPIFWSLFRL